LTIGCFGGEEDDDLRWIFIFGCLRELFLWDAGDEEA
jgi:hypothetical protein